MLRRFQMAASASHMLSPEVRLILQDNAELRYDKEKNKVVCCLSGHEMPSNSAAALHSYLGGKKFKKLQQNLVFDYNKYLPHIIPNPKKKFEKELVCTLTGRHFVKTPENVLRHVNGRRFQKALARWQRCQETGEEFKPFRRRPKQSQGECAVERRFANFTDSDSRASSVDSLSDLYPAADFPEEMEVDGETGAGCDIDDEEGDEEAAAVGNGDCSHSSKRPRGQMMDEDNEEGEDEEDDEKEDLAQAVSSRRPRISSHQPKSGKTLSRRPKKKKML